MSSNRQILFGAIGLIALVAAMARLFIWPGYREAVAVHRNVMKLQARIAGLSDANRQVTQLGQQVEELRRKVSQEYKTIPPSPEVAELIRKLSLPVDGVSVVDQTFTAGTAEEVPTGDKSPIKSLPLKVEMTATFDSIFALVRAAESMNQLMRISSLKVICKRDEKTSDLAPVLSASVGLEALFDPPQLEEGR